jgi:valyl-tRNA synthetase
MAWGDARLELPVPTDDGKRRDAERRRIAEELAKVETKLANPTFRIRAPAAIVAKEEQKASELRAALARLG